MTKKVDDNGWWIIKNNPLSKVGIYPYLGKQIDDSLEPNKIYRVFRPAEELLNEETVKSFNLVPLVNDHEMIGKDFKPAEEKGIDGIIYNPRVAHGDMLMGNIKIYSEKMMDDIKNGKKELSMGYTCTYDLTPGDWDGQHYDVVQRNLRGNHVALVDKGRMGSDVRVYDKHICCDSMDITGDIKRVRAEDITHDTWRLRKDTGLNYVTTRKESTINRLIKESGLPIARKTEATKLYGMPNYRNRFDAKFKEDEAWLNAQKVRFKQTRKKVGWRKLLEMPSFQRYKAKEEELRDILARRDAIEKEVYGARAGLDTAWIKVPREQYEDPNIMDKVVTKSAEAAAIMALLSTVLKMNKENGMRKKQGQDGKFLDEVGGRALGGAALGGLWGALNPSLLGGSVSLGFGRGVLEGMARGAVLGGGSGLVNQGLKKVFPKMNPHLQRGLSTAAATPLAFSGLSNIDMPKSALLTGILNGIVSATSSENDKKRITKRRK